VDNIHNFTLEMISKIEGIPEIAYVADIIMRRISFNDLTGHLEPMPG
jgi:hypothetical protein